MIREDITTAIEEALASLGAPQVSFVVERPAEMEHGDYATNAALAAAKILKKNPVELAEEIKANILSKKSSGRLCGLNQTIFAEKFFRSFLIA